MVQVWSISNSWRWPFEHLVSNPRRMKSSDWSLRSVPSRKIRRIPTQSITQNFFRSWPPRWMKSNPRRKSSEPSNCSPLMIRRPSPLRIWRESLVSWERLWLMMSSSWWYRRPTEATSLTRWRRSSLRRCWARRLTFEWSWQHRIISHFWMVWFQIKEG